MSIEDIGEEIDPPTCEQCSCVIEDSEALIYLRAADLVTQWELADPHDAWRHRGERRPRGSDIPAPAKPPYRTPQATAEAFWFVVRLGDQQRLSNWLKDHPADATFLLKLLEQAA